MKQKINLNVPSALDAETQMSNVTESPTDIRKLITRDKVAEYLNVSIQTVINYTNKGWLVAYKIGRRVLYNADEVLAAIQTSSVKRYQHESTRTYIFNK